MRGRTRFSDRETRNTASESTRQFREQPVRECFEDLDLPSSPSLIATACRTCAKGRARANIRRGNRCTSRVRVVVFLDHCGILDLREICKLQILRSLP